MENEDFIFTCNATTNVTMSIIIDGATTGPKYARIKTSPNPNTNATNYTFTNTVASDNGTTFMCMGINGNMTYKSTIFTLQVYCKILYYNNVVIIDVVIVDPPKFEEGNNVTILKEFVTIYRAQIVATPSGANPPNISFIITNDSTNTSDVEYEVCPY